MSISVTDDISQLLLKAGVILPASNSRVLNIDIINWSAFKLPILSHDSTDITKSNKDIQKELAMSLLFIAEEIKSNRFQYETSDVQKIYDIFRNHIQRSYQLGIAYVNNIFNTKGFIDDNDLKVIKFLTEYYTNVFTNNIDKMLNDPAFLFSIDRYILDIREDRLEKSNLFNYLVHSISATFQALEVATVVKTIVLYNDNSLEVDVSKLPADLPILQFQWVSSLNEKGCPICSELAKQTWSFNEWQSIPLVPHNSHPRCTCRIMLSPTQIGSFS